MKRSLIVGIVFLFLSTTCLPVLANEEKPDLIIEDIGFAPDNSGMQKIAYIIIKNIGYAKSQEHISYKYVFTHMLLGIIPIRIVRTNTLTMSHEGGLQPQEVTYVDLIYEYELPKFGFFRFSCTVNPGKTMEESNYDNNDFSRNYLALFGYWISLG